MEDHVIIHYGIPLMKWGVRRFQNKDGTLTAAGRARYQKQVDDAQQNPGKGVSGVLGRARMARAKSKLEQDDYLKSEEGTRLRAKEHAKRMMVRGAIIGGVLGRVGGTKIAKMHDKTISLANGHTLHVRRNKMSVDRIVKAATVGGVLVGTLPGLVEYGQTKSE